MATWRSHAALFGIQFFMTGTEFINSIMCAHCSPTPSPVNGLFAAIASRSAPVLGRSDARNPVALGDPVGCRTAHVAVAGDGHTPRGFLSVGP